MRADQVRVVDIGVIQIALGLHLRLHRLHHLALTQQLVVDLDAGDLLECLGKRFRLILVSRNSFRQDVDFHSLERRGCFDEPLHLLHLCGFRQRGWLELVVYPLLRFRLAGERGGLNAQSSNRGHNREFTDHRCIPPVVVSYRSLDALPILALTGYQREYSCAR